MATDSSSGRPRPWLVVLLGVLLAAFVVSKMFPGDARGRAVSTTNPRPPGGQPSDRIDPAELDVKIEALRRPPDAPKAGDRNPFRFQPKAPPPPPPAPRPVAQPTGPTPIQPAPLPLGEPPPTPIGNLVKFIGIVETGSAKIGAFTDCRYTFAGREGEVVEGRFRVVRIGVESAVLEYTDGRGRTTLPLNGQGCPGK